MDLLQQLPGCILAAFENFITPEEITSAASENQGNEKVIYPFFNIEICRLLKMEALIGLGSGQVGITRKEEIDCLLVHKNSERIGIEIKGGPSKKSYLLAGSTKSEIDIRFTPDSNTLKSNLTKCYNQDGTIYYDSQIGDIIKLTNLIYEGYLSTGYSIGLLSYTDQRGNEKVLYKEKLVCMCDFIKSCAHGLSFRFFCMDGIKYRTFITVIGISGAYNL